MDIVDEAAVLIETVRQRGVTRAAQALAEPGAAECVGCGEEIEASRRQALPSARRCLVCQTRVERRERLHRGNS